MPKSSTDTEGLEGQQTFIAMIYEQIYNRLGIASKGLPLPM